MASCAGAYGQQQESGLSTFPDNSSRGISVWDSILVWCVMVTSIGKLVKQYTI